MERAGYLLDASSASVKEVAAALGYDDPFYFSRVFKLVNRVSPSRFRTLQNDPCAVKRTPGKTEENKTKTRNRRIVHSFRGGF